LVIFAITFAAVNRRLECVIEATSYNQVAGRIDINFTASTNGTAIHINLTTTTGLVSGNNVHIHQYGLDSKTTSCGEVGAHYNPILNYGEVSGKLGVLPQNGSVYYNSNWLSFEGEYSVVGRSFVIHNNTASRFGCCTIKLVEDAGTAVVGYSKSVLLARFPGIHITLFEQTAGVVAVKVNVTDITGLGLTNSFTVRTTADCNSPVFYTSSANISTGATVTDQTTALTGITYFGNFAGRAVVLSSGGCAIFIQKAAQPNTNEVYVTDTNTYVPSTATPTTSATTPTATATPNPSTTNNANIFIFSVLFFIASLLI